MTSAPSGASGSGTSTILRTSGPPNWSIWMARMGGVPSQAMELEGIPHTTATTGDARRNVDFYVRVLGLRMVKKTVNQDDPDVYHLFYGDEDGSPGMDLTFFEYPGAP